VLQANPRYQQEQPVNAIESPADGGRVIEVPGAALGSPWQGGGARGVTDQDAAGRALSIELANQFATDVASGTSDQYHVNS
jgi:hypothetical protein